MVVFNCLSTYFREGARFMLKYPIRISTGGDDFHREDLTITYEK